MEERRNLALEKLEMGRKGDTITLNGIHCMYGHDSWQHWAVGILEQDAISFMQRNLYQKA